MSGATFSLAAFALSAQPGVAQRERAIGALVDTVGCAMAGLNEPVVAIVGRSVAEAEGHPTAGVWGTARRVSAADAAFLNGVASHALDFDDNMPTLRGHPSTSLWPVALSVGESVQASGRAMLDAYVIGLEVDGKLGLAFGAGHYTRGWHATSSVGIFGAAAAAARLLGLTAQQLCTAFGIAASQMSGLLANFGTMTKPFHAGHAARSGVQAALLARDGLTANDTLFDEGARSVFASYAGEGALPLETLLPTLGTPWEIDNPGVFVKLWPCCYCSHRPIAGYLELAQRHGLRFEEIQEIAVGFPPGTDAGLIKRRPENGLAGKFSIEFTMAALAVDGAIGLQTFSDSSFSRPEVQQLMGRVRAYAMPDTRSWSSTVGYNEVEVLTARGRFALRVDATPGAPFPPMPARQLDAKFRDCAGLSLTAQRAGALLHALRSLDDAPDATRLMRTLLET